MNLEFWTDVSIVFLAIQTFILLLIPLVAFYFAVRGLNFLHIRLPRVMSQAQNVSKQVRLKTEAASERVADPIVRAQRARTKAETTLRSLVPRVEPSGAQSTNSRTTSGASKREL